MRNPSLEFGASEKQGVYDAIYKRRDVRGQFLADPVPDALLYKLLDAAHHTGSVGFMQPWSFIIIRSDPVKRQVKSLFQEANEAAIKVFEGLPRTWETSIACPSQIQTVPHTEDEDRKDPVRVGLDFVQPDTPRLISP